MSENKVYFQFTNRISMTQRDKVQILQENQIEQRNRSLFKDSQNIESF